MSPARKRLIILKILPLTLILTALLIFTPLQSRAATSALWHFDEGDGVVATDSSVNSNDGTLKYVTNSLCNDADGPDWTTGKLGSGLRFDGCNDYVSIPFSPSLDILDGTPFSFSIWFKIDILPSAANRHYIIFQQGNGTISGSGKSWIYINKNNDEISTVLGGSSVSSGVKVTTDTWYFVTLNYDGTDLNIYVNGEYKASPLTTEIVQSDGNYFFGVSKNPDKPFWFSGTIDEVTIDDEALTEEEIAEEYLKGSVVALWYMDEDGGSIIYDDSSNHNNGDLKYLINSGCSDADGPDWTTGKVGSAVRFDGCNDYVSVPFSSSLDLLDGAPFAFSIWFKVDMLPSAANRHYIIFQQLDGTISGSGKSWIYINKNNDEIGTALGGSGFLSGVKVTADTWYFVTLNYDGTDVDIYVEGEYKASPLTTEIIRSDGDYLFGLYKNINNPFWFEGTIDEVRLFDRALTGQEITSVHTDGPPLVPTGLEAIPGDGVIDLSWYANTEPDLLGYNIYRSTESGGPYSILNTVPLTTSSYSDYDVTHPTTYYYVVTAVDTASNESAYSSEVSATPVDTTPPTPPTGLTASVINTAVELSWNPPEPDLAGYYIYRSTESGIYNDPLNSEPIYDPAYTDSNVFPGLTYYYVVTAVDMALNESDPSSEVSVTISAQGPSPPTNLTAYPGDNKVAIKWDANQEDEDIAGYNVYRGTQSGVYDPTPLNSPDLLTNTSFSDDTVTNGTTYYYVVTAVSISAGESGYSNEVEVIPINNGPTTVSGNITTDTTWTLSNSPYIVTGNISVYGSTDTPVTLTIEPGVEVRFNQNKGLYIGKDSQKGELNATGTAANPIIFTSIKKGNEIDPPEPGDWTGISFWKTNESILDNVIVEYGGDGSVLPNIYPSYATLTIKNSKIRYSSGNGIYLLSSNLSITNSEIYGNVIFGICSEDSSVDIENNTFSDSDENNISYNNGSYDLYLLDPDPNNSSIIIKGNTFNNGLYFASGGGTSTIIGNIFNNYNNYPLRVSANTVDSLLESNIFNGMDSNSYLEVNGGHISRDATWTNIVTYKILGDIFVYGTDVNKVTLTIEPGVKVKFDQNKGLYIGKDSQKGELNATGTAANPIIFTSIKKGNEIDPPKPGDWTGISFWKTNESILDNVIVEYGGDGSVLPNIYPSYATLTIKNSKIRYSSGNGIYLLSSNLSITNSEIYGNVIFGICSEDSSTSIKNSNIYENTSGIYNATPSKIIDARLNWWGDASGPAHSSNPNGIGDAINDSILYEPWLGQESTSPFAFTSASVSPKLFTQNGGWTTFFLNIYEDANWTITISDSTVKTINGTGDTINTNWTGDDNNGVPLENGTYKYIISAANAAAEEIVPAVGYLTLNSDLPIANITYPIPGQIIGGIINIIGTAKDDINFASYDLYYGSGASPSSWTKIKTSTTQVDNNLLFANWTVPNLGSEKVATIKLIVTDTDSNTAEDRVTVNLLNIYNISDAPDPFSPDQDGIKDTTTISANITQLANWTINIKDPSDTVIKTYTGTDTGISQVWDGTDITDTIVAEGTYAYEIIAEDPDTGTQSNTITRTVTTDLTYPLAEITDPTSGDIITGSIDLEIIGTASDADILSYKVEYGEGAAPTSWTLIPSSITGTLATLKTLDIANGDYTIKLTVTDNAGNISTDSVFITLNSIKFTNVSTTQTTINPDIGETSGISYTLDRDSYVTIKIYDKNYDKNSEPPAIPVRTIIESAFQSQGSNIVNWDGKNDSGVVLDYEAYTYTIHAVDADGMTGIYDPEYVTGPVNIQNAAISPDNFDPYQGQVAEITYELVAPARVTLKIGIPNAANPVRTLIDNEPRDITDNVELWDGQDDNGNVVEGATYKIAGWTTILPDNVIITSNKTLKITELSAEAYLIILSYNEISTINYTISGDATVTMDIYGPNGSHFRTLIDAEPKTAGSHTIEWDGTDKEGSIISTEGDYSVEVTVADSSGNIAMSRRGSIAVYK